MKAGIGYDIHPLRKGRKLFIGTVEIPYSKGLSGHSDADVLAHAVCDALLGAIGKGDIGKYFPDSQKKFRGITGREMLSVVFSMVERKGLRVGNLDCIIVAKEPKLGGLRAKIEKNISSLLKVRRERVNIKAKTNNSLGDTGRGRAIAAYALVSVLPARRKR